MTDTPLPDIFFEQELRFYHSKFYLDVQVSSIHYTLAEAINENVSRHFSRLFAAAKLFSEPSL